MKGPKRSDASESRLALTVDLLSAKVLVWVASVGRDADLTDEAHRFFFDRYHRLAEHHRARGRLARARRLQEKAEEHNTGGLGAPTDGPYAAAMAMPRPRRFVSVDAVSRMKFDGPDDAA
jgi:transposase InsO family protein